MNNTFKDLLNQADDLSGPMREVYEAGMALEKENAELRAHVELLREKASLFAFSDESTKEGCIQVKESDIDALDAVIAETPAQSLRKIQMEKRVKELEDGVKYLQCVLGPNVPKSVTDDGARYEWGDALLKIEEMLK